MIVKREKERTEHALIYLAENTPCPSSSKLCAMLLLLDIEHFARIGRSFTGLDYETSPDGVAPIELCVEWNQILPPTKSCDLSYFSAYQLELLENFARNFSKCEEHPLLPSAAEEFAQNFTCKKRILIPYKAMVKAEMDPEAKEHAEEIEEFERAFGAE